MSAADLPEPFTPPDCDLRSQDWMELRFKQLRNSDFWLDASDQVKVISIELWCASYEQVPAASLPARDDRLSEFAGFGRRGLQEWHAVKEEVMKAWTMCSDGRWYHPTVAEVALKAWIIKLRDRARKKTSAGAHANARLVVAEDFLGKLLMSRRLSLEGKNMSAENSDTSTENDVGSDVTGPDRTGPDSTGPDRTAPDRTALTRPRANTGDLLDGVEPSTPKRKPTPMMEDFEPPTEWLLEAVKRGNLSNAEVREEWDGFKGYWLERASLRGSKGKKIDWKRTWINYVTSDICQRRVAARRRNAPGRQGSGAEVTDIATLTLQNYRRA